MKGFWKSGFLRTGSFMSAFFNVVNARSQLGVHLTLFGREAFVRSDKGAAMSQELLGPASTLL